MSASLPHAYPFRLVDTVELAPERGSGGLSATGASPPQGRASTRVSANSRVVGGQAWASPLLLAEAIAQAALMLEGDDAEVGRRGFLAGVDGFEVTRLPQPGESLSISVRLSAHFGAVAKFDGEIRSGEEILARSSILVKKGEGGKKKP